MPGLFTPSSQEIERARQIVAAAERQSQRRDGRRGGEAASRGRARARFRALTLGRFLTAATQV
jgi:citrate lyase beta subunit